jgi:hypothetical protein
MMKKSETVLEGIRNSLAAIGAARYFESERGFQGALLVQLEQHLQLPDQTLVEQEYQKRQQEHGLKIRPDIIIHEPFDASRHASRSEGNLAVIELKLRASEDDARGDFESLATIMRTLQYPLGVFINIASFETYAQLTPEDMKGRIVAFAVVQNQGRTRVFEDRI